MHTHWAEVAPLAPLMIPISEICLCLFVLGIIACIAVFVRALFGTVSGVVGWIPYLNKVVQAPLHSIEKKITSALGEAERAVDARMGAALHQLARMVDWLGREIRAHANLLWTLSTLFLGTATTGLLHAGLALLHLRIKSAVATADTALHRLIALEKRFQHAIATNVYPRLGRLEHEIGVTIPKDVAGLRVRTKTIEGELSKLWDLLRKNEAALATTAFAGAVALALDRIGLRWLKCNGLRSLGSRLECGGWRLLDDLLAGIIDVLVIADLCQLTKLLIEVAQSSEVQGVLSGVIGGIDELLLCQGVTRPAALEGYESELPPLQTFAALPAV